MQPVVVKLPEALNVCNGVFIFALAYVECIIKQYKFEVKAVGNFIEILLVGIVKPPHWIITPLVI